MLLLRKSCCGCSLKAGALIVSYLQLIPAIVTILNFMMGSTVDFGNDKNYTSEYRRMVTWFCVVTIIIVSHALYGIYKKKAGYMIPFLLFKLFFLFLLILLLMFTPTFARDLKPFIAGSNEEEDILPCLIVSFMLAISIEVYALLIVYSYYHILRQEVTTSTIPAPVTFSNLENAEATVKVPPPPYAV